MRFKEFINQCEREYCDGEVAMMYMHNPSMKVHELCKITGRSVPELYRILRANEYSPNRLKTNHGFVLDCHTRGHSVKDIANMSGYTERNIRYILCKHKTMQE